MSWREDLNDAIGTKLRSIVGKSVPVMQAFSVEESELEQIDEYIEYIRVSTTADELDELNPDYENCEQYKTVDWILNIKTGCGGNSEELIKTSDSLLTQLQEESTGLTGYKPLGEGPEKAGALNLVDEFVIGRDGHGLLVRQTWTHKLYLGVAS